MQLTSVSVLMGAVTESFSLEKTVEEILSLPEDLLIKEILIAYPADRISKACRNSLNKIQTEFVHRGIEITIIPQKTPKMGFFTDLISICKTSHCVFFSSDNAMPVSLIKDLIEKERNHPNCIVSSSRWLKQNGFHDYDRRKLLLNRWAQVYLRLLYNTELTDLTNAVQIAPTAVMKKINWEEKGFARGMEMVLKPLRLGVKFIEIPTEYTGRTDGFSSNSVFELPLYILTSLRIRFMSKRKILADNSC